MGQRIRRLFVRAAVDVRAAVARCTCLLLLAPVMGAVCADGPAHVADPDGPALRAATRLRIACFNAENLAVPGERTRLTRFRFEPARRRHIEGVAAVIEAIAPDILVLSEVVSDDGVEAVAALLREKGVGDYRAYHVEGSDGFSGFDVAFLTKLVPDDVAGAKVHIHLPPRRPDRDARPAEEADWRRADYVVPAADGGERRMEAVLQRHALAYFTVAGHRLGILGLHLKSNPSDSDANAQRSAEARIARQLVLREIVARGYLPVVLGDLNDYDPDVPMADGRRTTQTTVLRDLKDFDPKAEGPELVNAARFIPRVADRFTSHWDFNENGAPDGDDVRTMIDHVLLPRQLEAGVARVFICHASGLEISDHFPVVVDLDLR